MAADGTAGSTTTTTDSKGNVTRRQTRSKWKIESVKGRTATVSITRLTGVNAGETRKVRLTFLSDDEYRLDDDPALKGLPFHPPRFRRAKPAKKKKPK